MQDKIDYLCFIRGERKAFGVNDLLICTYRVEET